MVNSFGYFLGSLCLVGDLPTMPLRQPMQARISVFLLRRQHWDAEKQMQEVADSYGVTLFSMDDISPSKDDGLSFRDPFS